MNNPFGTRLLESIEPFNESLFCGTRLISEDGQVLNRCTKLRDHDGPCRLSLFPSIKPKECNQSNCILPFHHLGYHLDNDGKFFEGSRDGK